MVAAIVLSHFSACIFFAVSTSSCQFPLHDDPILCETDIALSEVLGSDLSLQYLTAFYWAVTTLTTIGYGDIVPITKSEKIYCIFVMLLGGGFYG